MPRNEILSPEGFRSDGRRWNETRRFRARIGLPTCTASSDGSSLVTMGLTTAMCVVSGPREPSGSLRGQVKNDRAFLNIYYNLSAFSGQERKRAGRTDKRIQEIQNAVESTFNEVVLLKLYPRSQIDVTITILQQDGGAVAAAMNAVTLALIDAGIPMYTFISAITAGTSMTETIPQAILDLSSLEENDVPWLTIATEGSGIGENINFMQCETRMTNDVFLETMSLAVEGAKTIRQLLIEVCRLAGKEYKDRNQR